MVKVLRIVEEFDPEQPKQCWFTSKTENLQSWKRLHWSHSQLVTVADMASLMAFFSITAAVELQIKEGSAGPKLIIAYVITTSLLVGCTVLVKIISSSILPQIECIADTMAVSDVHRSPHDQLFTIIHLTCVMGQTLAPFLFCMDLILIAWIKFAHLAIEAPIAVTFIIAPVQIIILIFGRAMYKRRMEFSRKHHLLPNRRYSEIAETWDENDDDDDDEDLEMSDEALLLNSHSSSTSYGAVVRNGCNMSAMKVYADCLH